MEHSSFLLAATSRIGSTLNVRQTVRELVQEAVPRFADFASVHLDSLTSPPENTNPRTREGSTALWRAAIAHTGDEPHLARIRTGKVFRYAPGTAMVRFLTAGEAALIPHVGEADLARLPKYFDNPGTRRLLKDCSLLVLPLAARGAKLGFAVLGRRPARTPFDELDLGVGWDLAGRAALCVDNARLYTRHPHTTALTSEQ